MIVRRIIYLGCAMNRKKIIEKMERIADAFFSEKFQAKLYLWAFGMMGVFCFIDGFWNNIHFLFSAMCGLMCYVTINELKK